jgi:hypothetical protein
MLVGLAGVLALAPTARAAFHEILIREVHPGSLAQPDSGYVVLQMYIGGQQFVAGHTLTTYGAGGAQSGTFTFPDNLPNGASQQTILVGDTGVEAAFAVAPDLVSAGFALDPAGGAVCWAGSFDCVAWGAFAGSTPSASGSPADPLGIPNAMALRRTIEPGCPTLLQAADDTNDSATDFFDATPQPRNNASAITEAACTGPATTIDTKPPNPTNATSASFTYHSTPAGASFECRLDTAAFAACDPAGVEYAGPLGDGQHSFQVRGKSGAGILGAAATYGWRVDTIAPAAAIDSAPADPSAGASASFTFHASEAGSSFECSLTVGAGPDSYSACVSGKTYTDLDDGEHTFKVQASDAAGNQGGAAVHEWTVDNSLADTTPPDTLIDSAPPDPSESSTASFTYHSTEPGSSFECKLDTAAFAACPAGGVTYTGLAGGSHGFQVRATDASGNLDPTPAGYSFAVVLPAPPPAAPAATSPSLPAAAPVATAPPRKQRPRRKRCARRKHRGKAAHAQAGKRRCKRGKAGKRGKGKRATASAFHLVLLREVYPGSVASPNAEYVVLQMYAGGQEFVKGHRVELFDGAGGSLGAATFDADVARGASQSTILLASPEAEAQFGFGADKGMVGGKLDPAGGAVCWEGFDCVSWGGFSGSLPSPAGAPADPLGIADGMALRRTIEPGCPTLLESSDDRDDGATDFFDAFPAPRPNATPPSERPCPSQGAAGGGGGQGSPGGKLAGRPQTRLRRRPAKRTGERRPTFGFASSHRGSTFLCKLDRRPFRRCRSPHTTPRLGFGPHVFRVKARAPGGLTDRSPATWRFKVIRRG